MADKIYKFNITAKELAQALEYAKKNSTTEFKTITMTVNCSSGIGNEIGVHHKWNKTPINITETESW